MIFTVPSYAQPPSLNRGKAKTNGFAESGSVDMRDLILFTNSTIGEVETLSGYISIRIGGIIGTEPKEEKIDNISKRKDYADILMQN